MEFTNKERNNFNEWAKGFNSWVFHYERDEALTREFVKTLTDEQIKLWFKIGKRNRVEITRNSQELFSEMNKFLTTAMKELNIKGKKKEEKEMIKASFDSDYDLQFCGDTLTKVISLLGLKTDGLSLQDVFNTTFQGKYYSIPYGLPRTIERNHNAEVLHAIYNKFGGVAIIKTARKVIGVKMETGQKNSACPIPIIQAINLLKEMRDERVKEHGTDDVSLKDLKEKCEMEEVVRKI